MDTWISPASGSQYSMPDSHAGPSIPSARAHGGQSPEPPELDFPRSPLSPTFSGSFSRSPRGSYPNYALSSPNFPRSDVPYFPEGPDFTAQFVSSPDEESSPGSSTAFVFPTPSGYSKPTSRSTLPSPSAHGGRSPGSSTSYFPENTRMFEGQNHWAQTPPAPPSGSRSGSYRPPSASPGRRPLSAGHTTPVGSYFPDISTPPPNAVFYDDDPMVTFGDFPDPSSPHSAPAYPESGGFRFEFRPHRQSTSGTIVPSTPRALTRMEGSDHVGMPLGQYVDAYASIPRPLSLNTQYLGPNTPSYPLRRAPVKKALCIGCNYIGLPRHLVLYDCIEGANVMAKFLHEKCGFEKQNIVVLTDQHSTSARMKPTHYNIIEWMNWLVHDAQPGDSLFFMFSGHGIQVPDEDGDESDGFDEALVPIDFRVSGCILDDTLHDVMLKPLPVGCRLRAVMDSCHSGTSLDLTYSYMLNQSYKIESDQKPLKADVVSWGACEDGKKCFVGGKTPGMTKAFIELLSGRPLQSYHELLQGLSQKIDREDTRYLQKPQLSTSLLINTDDIFYL